MRMRSPSVGARQEGDADAIQTEAEAEMMAAAKEAEAKPVPSLDTIFTDVYAEVPPHLRAQSDFAIGHYSSRGEGVNEKGEFPL